MADPIAPIAPATAVPPVQPVHNSAAVTSSTRTHSAGNVNLVTEFEQAAALQNEEEILSADLASAIQTSGSGSSANGDSAVLDGAVLANLSPESLIALSEANTGINSAGTDGTLTPTQVEEIATLKIDAQILNMAPTETVTVTETFANDGSLLEGASTVNLSSQAVNILNEVKASASVGIEGSLTPAQLQQLAGILTPFINQPLTQATLTQIQNALVAAGFNPTQISLQNMFLSMNYTAELLPVSSLDGELLALSETMTTELLNT